MRIETSNKNKNIKKPNTVSIINKCMTYIEKLHYRVASLQKRNNKYDVFNVFCMLVKASFNNNCYSKFASDYCMELANSSSLSYWATKIYSVDSSDLHDYNLASENNSLTSKMHDNNLREYKNSGYDPSRIFDKYTVLAGDGTVVNCSIPNLNGKNVASFTISSLLNVASRTFHSYILDYDNSEAKALFNHTLTKSHLIILDRLYADIVTLKKLSKTTNFVVRLKKNLLITKNFIKSNKNDDIININKNQKIKLVKYYVDKKTKKAVMLDRKTRGDLRDEDSSDIYILATNILSLTIDDCAYLYKQRWSIEVAFKHLKSNFNVRHICKESNINDPISKNLFWINMSFFMYNMTTIIKNNLDHNDSKINCRFSKCADYVRKLIMVRDQNKENLKDNVNTITIIGKRFTNNRTPNKNVERVTTRGRYKSVNTILENNEEILSLKGRNR